jgi:hypothetical protein
MLFMRYIYLRHLQLSRSGSMPEMRAGQQTGARADSNPENQIPLIDWPEH